MTIIRFPWPPTELRPNFKRANHWSKYAPKASAYRKACWALACEQNVHKLHWPDGDIQMVIDFHPPKGCKWDGDAMFSAFKSGQDGLSDAMKVDDKRFRLTKTTAPSVDGGCVLVRIVTEGAMPVEVVGEVE